MSRATDYAQSVLVRHWDKILPVRPDKMIQSIDDVELRYEDLPDEVAGRMHYDFAKKTYVITVNDNHHQNRQRFTIAHELGHYALGHGEKKDTVLYRNGNSSNGNDPDEVEANVFASEILMPKGAILHLLFDKDIKTVKELSHQFWVSDAAMIYRLKNLGLVS